MNPGGERHGNTIGDKLLSLRSRGGNGKLRVVGRLATQVLREGRLSEVVVNLGREVLAPFRVGVDPADGAYESASTGLVRRRPTGLRLDKLPVSINGVCRGGTRPGKVWAWHGNSLLSAEDNLDRWVEVRQFENPITWVHETPNGNLLVATPGRLFVRVDASGMFKEALQLSHPRSKVRPRTAAIDPTGRLFVGEYGNLRDSRGRWISTAWIHWSDDEGENWWSSDILVRHGVNKHIHVLIQDSATGLMHATTGDSKKLVWSFDVQSGQPGPQLVVSARSGRPWELGGHLSAASSDFALYWGTDYWRGTNFVVAEYPNGTSQRWMMGSTIRRNPVASMAILRGQHKSYLLVASSNRHVNRHVGLSTLLSLDEERGVWKTMLITTDRFAPVSIAQCGCDGVSSWAHVKLGKLSYRVAERTESAN